MPFNITPATNTSNWLFINGINKFLADFNPNVPTPFEVIFKGWINEPCTASWIFNHPKPICEFVLHGTEGDNACCPLGLTTPGELPGTCGCRDDLDQTPYRMAYELATLSPVGTTTFNFSIARVDAMLNSDDFDGYDVDNNVPVRETDGD